MTPLAIDIVNLFDVEFLVSIGVVAGIYAIVALGLQLNAHRDRQLGRRRSWRSGRTRWPSWCSAGFSFWLALPCSMLVTMAFGVIVGLLELTTYVAIATLALAEVVRLFAQNAQPHGREPGPVLRGGRCLQLLPQRLERRLGLDQRVDLELLGRPAPAAAAAPGRWVIVAFDLRPQPDHLHAGLGPAGDPRGRGRRPRPRQEHDRLQAAVAHDRCAARLAGRAPARAEPEDAAPGGVQPLVTFFAFVSSSAACELPGVAVKRSCPGSCSRGPATSTFRRTRS